MCSVQFVWNLIFHFLELLSNGISRYPEDMHENPLSSVVCIYNDGETYNNYN